MDYIGSPSQYLILEEIYKRRPRSSWFLTLLRPTAAALPLRSEIVASEINPSYHFVPCRWKEGVLHGFQSYQARDVSPSCKLTTCYRLVEESC